MYRKDIADRLGLHPKTITRALKQSGAPSRRRRRQKYAKLKPYLGRVDELLAAGELSRSRAQAKLAVFSFIEGWCNPHRRHSSIDCLSPVNYEKRLKSVA